MSTKLDEKPKNNENKDRKNKTEDIKKLTKYISHEGYVVRKSALNEREIKNVKKELKVRPKTMDFTSCFSDGSDEKNKDKSYKLYKEDDDNIYLPRYYGVSKFGDAPVLMKSKKAKFNFLGELRDYQKTIVKKCYDGLITKGGGLLAVPCGAGKCMSKGTMIIMHDGSVKPVELVEVGDKIMGDDSTPRTVLSLARGREEMFDIIPTKGDKYTVNRSHILSLKWDSIEKGKIGDVEYNKGDVIDISVDEYLKLPKWLDANKSSSLKGYRVPLEFGERHVSLDPYMLGSWLANSELRYETETTGYFYDQLKNLNLLNNKHIPEIYKCNSRDIRLKILAGILDICGSLHTDCSSYVLTLKSEKLTDDMIYLARSLGFACYKMEPFMRDINDNYRVCISGNDLREIPTSILHVEPINEKENPLIYGIKVQSVGEGDYYGFEIDGNKRFVLGDFTVTHNTSMAIFLASVLKERTLVFVHKSFLMDQWIERIKQFTNASVGIIRGSTVDIEGKDFVIGMIQSISKKDYGDIFKDFTFVIYDESHHCASRVFSRTLMKTRGKYTLALSATPYRTDGLINVMHWFLGETLFRIKYKINKHVAVKNYYYYTNDKKFAEKKKWYKGRMVSDTIKMLSNLCEIEERSEHISNIINELRKDPERKIIVFSERKILAEKLKELVDKKLQKDIEERKILRDEIKTFTYFGGDDTKKGKAQRAEAEKFGDIIFATYQMAKEGLDIERLNTVILATSIKDIDQTIGRGMRKLLKNGDVKPLVIDFIDDTGAFSNHSEIRRKHYKKCKYEIQDYFIQNDKFVSKDAYVMHFKPKNEQEKDKANPEKFIKYDIKIEDTLLIDKIDEINEDDIKLVVASDSNMTQTSEFSESEDCGNPFGSRLI